VYTSFLNHTQEGDYRELHKLQKKEAPSPISLVSHKNYAKIKTARLLFPLDTPKSGLKSTTYMKQEVTR
jgi:hypothetical protein